MVRGREGKDGMGVGGVLTVVDVLPLLVGNNNIFGCWKECVDQQHRIMYT